MQKLRSSISQNCSERRTLQFQGDDVMSIVMDTGSEWVNTADENCWWKEKYILR